MLKLVEIDSHQYRIFEVLLQQLDLFSDPTTFSCVIPPLAILNSPYHYAVVSMPMWSSPVYFADMRTVREVFRFMECLLQVRYSHVASKSTELMLTRAGSGIPT